MTTADQIRNGIIEELLTISNKDYLKAIFEILKSAPAAKGTVKLTEEQVVMLNMSERDIEASKLISHSDLDKTDLKWLKEQ
jgi:hypothetical protein